MAATFAPSTAANYITRMIKYMPVGDVISDNTASNGNILNDASNMIWMAAPWRWSVGVAGPSLVGATIAQGQPQTATFTIPSTFLRLEKCVVSNGASYRELKPIGQVPPAPTVTQWPNYAAITAAAGTSGSVQFDTLFPQGNWNLWFWYKKIAPIITSSNYTSAGLLVMDDEWFWVFNEAALYYAYKYADDPRAGSSEVQLTPQGAVIKYSGQLSVVHSAIEEMRRSENLVMGFPLDFPVPVKEQ